VVSGIGNVEKLRKTLEKEAADFLSEQARKYRARQGRRGFPGRARNPEASDSKPGTGHQQMPQRNGK
jgi:hypothetical protein